MTEIRNGTEIIIRNREKNENVYRTRASDLSLATPNEILFKPNIRTGSNIIAK